MPEAINIPIENGLVRNTRTRFVMAGIDEYTDPPAQDSDSFSLLTNVITGVRPRIIRRWGTTLFSNPTMDARRIYEAHFSNARNRFILSAANGSGADGPDNRLAAINENGDLVTTDPIMVPSASAVPPVIATARNFVYIVDGRTTDMLKWDSEDNTTGTRAAPTGALIPVVTNWGIETPAPAGVGDAIDAAPTAEGTGDIYLFGGRAYTVCYRCSLTGHTSAPAPNFTGRMGITSDPSDPTTGVTINLSAIPTSSDPQVDQRVILATKDGGDQTVLYEVAIIDDNSTTTYTDTKSEAELTNSPIWAEEGRYGPVGVFGNTTPRESTIDEDDDAIGPTLTCTFNGRIHVIRGHFHFWSKNLLEVTTSTGTVTGKWEECFPIENQRPLSSNGSETGTSLHTDDVRMYIGTTRAVYVFSGDIPAIDTPRALFQEVGVLNNAVWTTVFHEGTAVGAAWVTPDKRVIYSDFATYKDFGTAIQTSLTALPTTIVDDMTATFVADGPHEFFFIAPGGTDATVFVINVKTGRWVKWENSYSDPVRALSYMYDSNNIRTLPVFATSSGRVYRWNKDTIYDHSGDTPFLPVPQIRTNWLDLGSPVLRKALNSAEIQTDEPTATLTIEGANNEDDFDSPVNLGTVSFTETLFDALVAGTAHLQTQYRWYRFTFGGFDASTETDLLSYWAMEFAGIGNV